MRMLTSTWGMLIALPQEWSSASYKTKCFEPSHVTSHKWSRNFVHFIYIAVEMLQPRSGSPDANLTEGKGEVVPCPMKTRGRVEEQRHSFLISALGGRNWSASRPGRTTPQGKKGTDTHWLEARSYVCFAYSSTLKMEAVRFSQISVNFYRTLRRYFVQDSILVRGTNCVCNILVFTP
jgi:hypothetical protein